MRFRKDKPADLAWARTVVTAWRDGHLTGTAEQLIAEIGGQFHPDFGPVLRSVLFTVDRHRARQITGATGEMVQ